MRKVVVGFAFLAIALFTSVDLHAQSKTTTSKRKAAVATRSTAVVTELDRQRLFLQKVTSRYEAVSINEFTPYFSYTYVWKALKENRDHLSRQAKVLTPAQFSAVKKGYDMLEADVLRQFVDQQTNVLISELELNEVQINEVEKLLGEDLTIKRSLLSATGHSLETFAERVTAISDSTQRKIVALLFPEQRDEFQRELTFSRDRLVG